MSLSLGYLQAKEMLSHNPSVSMNILGHTSTLKICCCISRRM